MPTAREELGERLRNLRRNASLDQGRLARALNITQAQVSRIETGQRPISIENVRLWLDETNAPDNQRVELVELADQASAEIVSWNKVHAGGWNKAQKKYGSQEIEAEVVRIYQTSLIPGLLQNASYATFLLREVIKKPEKEIVSSTGARLRRQEALRRGEARVEAVITEAVLRQRFGGAAIMAEQLTHLASMSQLPTVDIAILPIDTDMPENYNESFVLFEMPDQAESRVMIETFAAGEVKAETPEKVKPYRDLHAFYWRYSLTGNKATDFLWSLAKLRMEQAAQETPTADGEEQ